MHFWRYFVHKTWLQTHRETDRQTHRQTHWGGRQLDRWRTSSDSGGKSLSIASAILRRFGRTLTGDVDSATLSAAGLSAVTVSALLSATASELTAFGDVALLDAPEHISIISSSITTSSSSSNVTSYQSLNTTKHTHTHTQTYTNTPYVSAKVSVAATSRSRSRLGPTTTRLGLIWDKMPNISVLSRSRTYASRVSSPSRPERSRAHPCLNPKQAPNPDGFRWYVWQVDSTW